MAHYKYPSKTYEGTPEIYKSYKGRFALTGTISDEGVEPDESGRKIVPKGTFIDKDGKISSLSEGTGGDPVGVTDSAFDVTNGAVEGAIVTEAHLIGKRLNFGEGEYDEAKGTQIESAVPGLRIYPRPPKAAAGGGSSISFPITVAQGGTGATDAETARTNLELDSKTNTDATKATAEAAKATAEQNKTDIQSLTERVTTLEG